MQALPTVVAVRSFTYDQANNVVRLDLASKFAGSGASESDGEAWYLVSGLSPAFWNSNAVGVVDRSGGTVNLLPALHLTLDGDRNYECPPDLLEAFAAKSAGQEQFNARCIK